MINIRCRSLCHRCEFFASGRIGRVEIGPGGGSLPRAVYEMSEAAAVMVQPCKSLSRILRRGAVFHGHEFFNDAHSLFLASLVIEPRFSRLRTGMAIIRRIASPAMILQLSLDLRNHAPDPNPYNLPP